MDNRDKIKVYIKEISEIKGKSSSKIIKVLKLELLERCLKRIGQFLETCDECNIYFQEIDDIISKVNEYVEKSDKNTLKEYRYQMKGIVEHLKKKHGLIDEGHYVSQYMTIGMTIGVSIGITMDNIAIGISLGIAVGVAIGSSYDAKAKKEGRVI
ncbi:hypothetical protein [Sporosalibacterium faouarense]|uniref:hypothetical protein n=1 Tax=Sporosalibacterium faouarense TaxID=516123 RepID=UPI00192C9CBB|nr:hypothetical protein [Sporosalibacterium faouarense]